MSADNRPKTVEYVTEAILAPTCGAAECHSTFSGNDHDVFDTVIGTRSSLVNNNLIELDSNQDDRLDPSNASLIVWVTQIDPFRRGIGRMPYDHPMAFEDVKFLEDWIAAGARGAQCNPGLNTGLACDGDKVVACDSSWNFGTPMTDCKAMAKSCINGGCL